MPSAVVGNSSASSAVKEGSEGTEGCYRAKRYAVKFQPPCIFLEYEDTSQKRRVRAVKLNGISSTVDVDRLTRKVIRSFPRKLEPTSVKYDQVRKLVVKLLECLAASEAAAAPPAAGTSGASRQTPANGAAPLAVAGRLSASRAGSDGAAAGGPLGPLPTASPRIDPRTPGSRLAQSMSGPGRGLSNSYRGSVESNMSRFSTSTADSSDEADDELLSALDELSRELGGGGAAASTSGLSSARANESSGSSERTSRDSSFSVRDQPSLPALGGGAAVPAPAAAGAVVIAAGGKSRFAAEAEKLVIGLEVTDELDLNKVTDVELRMAKQSMEEKFRKHQLRPGDPGYVYDKQEEFGPPTENNDWDDSGDEGEGSGDPEVDWADIHAAVAKPGGATDTVGKEKMGESPYNSNEWP